MWDLNYSSDSEASLDDLDFAHDENVPPVTETPSPHRYAAKELSKLPFSRGTAQMITREAARGVGPRRANRVDELSS